MATVEFTLARFVLYYALDCNKIGNEGLYIIMLNLHNIKTLQVGNQQII